MTPRGEAPKNPAGTNALGPVGIPPKAKATALPHKTPPQQGFLFLVLFFFLFLYLHLLDVGNALRRRSLATRSKTTFTKMGAHKHPHNKTKGTGAS
jgi:hypothetical protein